MNNKPPGSLDNLPYPRTHMHFNDGPDRILDAKHQFLMLEECKAVYLPRYHGVITGNSSAVSKQISIVLLFFHLRTACTHSVRGSSVSPIPQNIEKTGIKVTQITSQEIILYTWSAY